MEPELEPARDWKDDGSLPLDSQGQLSFFCIDASEEHSNPGVVYLFGKVSWHELHGLRVWKHYLCRLTSMAYKQGHAAFTSQH